MNKPISWLKTGFFVGVVFAAFNLIVSSSIYTNTDITHPTGYSDLKIFNYPNFVLGYPAVIASDLLIRPLFALQYETIPAGASYDQIVTINEHNQQSRDRYEAISLFFTLFIALTVYWFGVGLMVGRKIFLFRNRHNAEALPPVTTFSSGTSRSYKLKRVAGVLLIFLVTFWSVFTFWALFAAMRPTNGLPYLLLLPVYAYLFFYLGRTFFTRAYSPVLNSTYFILLLAVTATPLLIGSHGFEVLMVLTFGPCILLAWFLSTLLLKE